jgi:hypothetical protein
MAYGSNMNIEQMQHRCPTAKPVGKLILKGYKLLFRGMDFGAVATIEKHQRGAVPVLLWELEPADEDALDHYEGFPYLYRKDYLKIRHGSEPREAMVYIMNPGRGTGRPSPGYFQIIKDGYTRAGFDVRYLNEAVRVSAEKL